jgi:endonuclease G
MNLIGLLLRLFFSSRDLPGGMGRGRGPNPFGCLLVLAGLAVVALGLFCCVAGGFLSNLPLPQGGPPTAPPTGPPAAEEYPHLRWGNPSGAKEDEAEKDDYLMKKKYFALSYNNAKGTPNWVSWRLVKEDLGNAKRADAFVPDPDLPKRFKKVFTRDYAGSGFDRGHMCPHSDRASNDDASAATFVMTNIVPQSPKNNQRPWKYLEDYCQSLAEQGKELYIVSGPAGEGGEGSKGDATELADGKITVPKTTWKVVMVLDEGGEPTRDTRLIAVNVPNNMSVGDDWSKYRVAVKDVEALTGYTFFDQADPAILGPLKDKPDRERIRPTAPREEGR